MNPSNYQVATRGVLDWLYTNLLRIFLSLLVPAATFGVLVFGFQYLRLVQPTTIGQKAMVSGLAIIWGVGGALILYVLANWFIEQMSPEWTRRLQPFVFVGPAMAILTWYLALPTIRTFIDSLFNRTGTEFIWFRNYYDVFFTERIMLIALRNNLLWIIFGATLSVAFGLLIAVLADRSKFETFAKSFVFMPMAISMVGAGVIWKFIYQVQDVNSAQTGLLNAIWVGLGNQPQAWTALLQPWNNLFLIVIVIWLQTGYAMVLFSAAIKGIPAELLEAARVDGASEVQSFFKIMIPYIMGTIITVSTTIVIFTLKIFDVVMVMTGGQFDTHVIATQFYRQAFTAGNQGYAAALAIILLIAVIPVMIYNLKQFREREAF